MVSICSESSGRTHAIVIFLDSDFELTLRLAGSVQQLAFENMVYYDRDMTNSVCATVNIAGILSIVVFNTFIIKGEN